MPYPKVQLLPDQDRRLRAGHPWAYSNELRMDAAAKALPPGEPVCLYTADGRRFALAQFNPHSLIAARLLTRNTDATIDATFLERRLARALRLRERLFERPYYRLIHAEADGLPGLVVDRYGDVLVCQLNSAGIAALEAPLLEALERLLAPAAVVLRNDSPVRELEGLATEVRLVKGALTPPIEVEQNGLAFLADPLAGHKTGWYFDQRENRAFVAPLGRGQRVLDLYSYSAGFGLAAAAAGAASVLAVDRSQQGLDLAAASADAQRSRGRALGRAARRVRSARRARGREGALRPRDRRPAGLRAQQEGAQARPARLSQARARRGDLGRRGGLPRDRLLLAQRRPGRVRRRGPPRPARCRAVRAPDPPVGRRPGSSDPSGVGGIGLPQVLALRARVNH